MRLLVTLLSFAPVWDVALAASLRPASLGKEDMASPEQDSTPSSLLEGGIVFHKTLTGWESPNELNLALLGADMRDDVRPCTPREFRTTSSPETTKNALSDKTGAGASVAGSHCLLFCTNKGLACVGGHETIAALRAELYARHLMENDNDLTPEEAEELQALLLTLLQQEELPPHEDLLGRCVQTSASSKESDWDRRKLQSKSELSNLISRVLEEALLYLEFPIEVLEGLDDDDDTKVCEPVTPNNRECGECQNSGTVLTWNYISFSLYCYQFLACEDKNTGSCGRATATADCFATTCTGGKRQFCLLQSTRVASAASCSDNPFGRRMLLASSKQDVQGQQGSSPILHIQFDPKHRSLMGFLRIPKTGSTSVMNMLAQSRGMYPWEAHLPSSAADNKQRSSGGRGSTTTTAGRGAASCVFGYAPTEAYLGTPDKDAFWNGCPHVPLGKMVEQWGKSLPLWSPEDVEGEDEEAVDDQAASGQEEDLPEVRVSWSPEELEIIVDAAIGQEEDSKEDLPQVRVTLTEAENNAVDDNSPQTVTLNPFTMVRDPFTRLVSYFYYLRLFTDTNEFLKHTASVSQYERVRANDLAGWMELLHKEDGGCGLELPYQFKYIHEDVDEAIALIQGNSSPRVFLLLTECFEASLHLLTEQFCCFEEGSVESFVKSDGFKSNTNNKKEEEKPDEESLRALRAKAEVWFADDYKFYDAAVKQFKLEMEESGLDGSKFESCYLWEGKV